MPGAASTIPFGASDVITGWEQPPAQRASTDCPDRRARPRSLRWATWSALLLLAAALAATSPRLDRLASRACTLGDAPKAQCVDVIVEFGYPP